MKRRITIEQLDELTEGQKAKLTEWWKPEYCDCFYITKNYYKEWNDIGEEIVEYRVTDLEFLTIEHRDFRGGRYKAVKYPKEYCIPLLDIGQMIELLESKGIKLYRIGVDVNINNLCDALWKTVKEAL